MGNPMVRTKTLRRGAPLDFFLGDVVRLRKPHPCGGFDWTVMRLGADIGLRCHGCSRRVLLPRSELERRLKAFIERGPGFALAQELVSAAAAGDELAQAEPAVDRA
jgi:hypothetical protein